MDFSTIQKIKQIESSEIIQVVNNSGYLNIMVGNANITISCRSFLDNLDSEKNNLNEIIGKRIVNLEVVGALHDLVIKLDNGSVFNTECDSSSYENWVITFHPFTQIIAGPGNMWSVF